MAPHSTPLDYESFVLLPGAVNARPGMYMKNRQGYVSVVSAQDQTIRLSPAAPSFVPQYRSEERVSRKRSLSPDARSFIPTPEISRGNSPVPAPSMMTQPPMMLAHQAPQVVYVHTVAQAPVAQAPPRQVIPVMMRARAQTQPVAHTRGRSASPAGFARMYVPPHRRSSRSRSSSYSPTRQQQQAGYYPAMHSQPQVAYYHGMQV